MPRRTMLLSLAIVALGVTGTAAGDKSEETLRKYPNIARKMEEFSHRPLEKFVGTKQLKLEWYAVKNGQFSPLNSPYNLGSDGWDIVLVEPAKAATSKYYIKHENMFLRYDPQGENSDLSLSKTADEGTVWDAKLGPPQSSHGRETGTTYRRFLTLTVVNGPKKSFVAAADDIGLSLADPEEIKHEERRPARFVFKDGFSDWDDGK